MTTNFQRFDENALNILNDADYSSNTQRQNGVVAGLAQSSLHNKLFYQTSSMSSAIGQALSDLGYTVTDANYSGLVAALTAQLRGGFPKGYLAGKPVSYNSAADVIIPAGLKARSSDNTADMEVASNLTVTLASNGVNGLDAGSETANTWYYLYLIKNVSTGLTSGLFSTVNESASGSIALPSGYTVKRQLPFCVRNDGASNILKTVVAGGWPSQPEYLYDLNMSYFNGTSYVAGTPNILTAGTATSFTALSGSNLIPPLSTMAVLHSMIATNNADFSFRTTGSTLNSYEGIGWVNPAYHRFTIATNSSQQVDYKRNSGTGTLFVDVAGYVINPL